MQDIWNRRRQRGPLNRISEMVQEWLGWFGSVTHFIVWATVAVFLLQLILEYATNSRLAEWVLALDSRQLLRGFIWQPVTYMFLHDTGNLWHIVVNLLMLWFLGREVEYFIGPNYFARLYLLCGVAGAALWLAFNFGHYGYLLGASAAVLGCVIAYATLFPEREVTFLVFFVIPVTLKAKYLAMILVAFDVVALRAPMDSQVAHLAHLGGAAMGYLYIKHLGYGRIPGWMLRWQDFVAKLKPKRRSEHEPDSEEFIRDEVDPILDKISREGMQSLTRRERKILESAREHLDNKPR
jgi:membrane associated rhomboid family serine protease